MNDMKRHFVLISYLQLTTRQEKSGELSKHASRIARLLHIAEFKLPSFSFAFFNVLTLLFFYFFFAAMHSFNIPLFLFLTEYNGSTIVVVCDEKKFYKSFFLFKT